MAIYKMPLAVEACQKSKAKQPGSLRETSPLTCSVLLIEAASLVKSQLVAGRAQVKANMILAVLAVIATAHDWADAAAVASNSAGPELTASM